MPPPEDVTVREARPGEIGAVLSLWSRSRSPHAHTADDEAVVARLLDRSPDGLLVAVANGGIVGALIAAWDGWRGNMYRLAVADEHRRRGIALALVAAGEGRLRAHGARRVTALVAAGDEVAAAIWRAAGYEHDALISRFVRNL